MGANAFIPAYTYVNHKWCVSLDIKLSMRSEHMLEGAIADHKPEWIQTWIKNSNVGHIGIVNSATTPTKETMYDNITYRQFP